MALTKPAGTWTPEDLYSLPDDGRRYEVIERNLYVLPLPDWDHATTIFNLLTLLLPTVSVLGGLLRTAPLGVLIRGADLVQPDILAILPGSRAVGGGRGVQGPPDLVIEVVSPGHRVHDLLTKNALYALAGVREYWVVEPDRRSIEVLSLERDAFHTVQTASAVDVVVSPLLGDATFPLAAIFAEIRSEGNT